MTRSAARFAWPPDGAPITVVGVVGDVLHDWFQRRAPTVYRPLSQEAPFAHAFVVRTVGDPASVSGDLRRGGRRHGSGTSRSSK